VKKRTLRLLLWSACDRACAGCCNNDWNLDALPIVIDFDGFDEVILTGGEPMLNPQRVIETIKRVRAQTDVPIYVYTAKVTDISAALGVLRACDGMTVTLHEQKDARPWARFAREVSKRRWSTGKSLRLNVFEGLDYHRDLALVADWKTKNDIRWIADCPLPENEIFGRLS